MKNIHLAYEEIVGITGMRQHAAQLRALVSMRIPARLRPDGTVFVNRNDLSGTTSNKPARTKEPNFGALKHVTAQT